MPKNTKRNNVKKMKQDWSKKTSVFIDKVIAAKQAFNGRSNNKYELPASKLHEPIPSETVKFLNDLTSEFNTLIQEANNISQNQIQIKSAANIFTGITDTLKYWTNFTNPLEVQRKSMYQACKHMKDNLRKCMKLILTKTSEKKDTFSESSSSFNEVEKYRNILMKTFQVVIHEAKSKTKDNTTDDNLRINYSKYIEVIPAISKDITLNADCFDRPKCFKKFFIEEFNNKQIANAPSSFGKNPENPDYKIPDFNSTIHNSYSNFSQTLRQIKNDLREFENKKDKQYNYEDIGALAKNIVKYHNTLVEIVKDFLNVKSLCIEDINDSKKSKINTLKEVRSLLKPDFIETTSILDNYEKKSYLNNYNFNKLSNNQRRYNENTNETKPVTPGIDINVVHETSNKILDFFQSLSPSPHAALNKNIYKSLKMYYYIVNEVMDILENGITVFSAVDIALEQGHFKTINEKLQQLSILAKKTSEAYSGQHVSNSNNNKYNRNNYDD